MNTFVVGCCSRLHNAFRHGGVGEHGTDDILTLGIQLTAEHSRRHHLSDVVADHVAAEPVAGLGIEDDLMKPSRLPAAVALPEAVKGNLPIITS